MSSFRWTRAPWGDVLECEALSPLARHVFTARGLDVPHPGDGAGWTPLAAYMEVDEADVWRMRQVHGVTVHTDIPSSCDGTWADGDLLATDRSDVALAVRTADCVPILYADARTGAVAAVHAGWRGSAAAAASHMVSVMAGRFGTRAADLMVAIGPSIGPETYEVGQEVVDAFTASQPLDSARGTWWRASARDGRYLLDLWTVTRDQLAAAGVRPDRIHLAGLCTATHADVFESYRVNCAAAGRMAAAIRRTR